MRLFPDTWNQHLSSAPRKSLMSKCFKGEIYGERHVWRGEKPQKSDFESIVILKHSHKSVTDDSVTSQLCVQVEKTVKNAVYRELW